MVFLLHFSLSQSLVRIRVARRRGRHRAVRKLYKSLAARRLGYRRNSDRGFRTSLDVAARDAGDGRIWAGRGHRVDSTKMAQAGDQNAFESAPLIFSILFVIMPLTPCRHN